MKTQRRILSGMRPTGPLHIGHLLGALKNWVKFQDKYDCLFMIADWHALLSEYERPQEIKKYVFELVADWIGCGINPKKCKIFLQSQVCMHLELNTILSSFIPLSWLERNPTYKQQLKEMPEKQLKTYGFLGYPVLQASDILIYKASLVPVGMDQLPHLELAREIARKFNNLYNKKIFPEPKPILTENPKILGIDNRKMSKSYDNFIALGDTPEVIMKKVLSMFTDPKRIKYKDPGHPEKCNVFWYYKTFKPELVETVKKECKMAKIGCVEDKKRLAEILTHVLTPIRRKREELLKNKNKILQILEEGKEYATTIAQETINQVKEIIGFDLRTLDDK